MSFGRRLWMHLRGGKVLFSCRGIAGKAYLGGWMIHSLVSFMGVGGTF
jgi:hypothetical protein